MKNLFIGSLWLAPPPRDGATLPVVSPADGEVFDPIARGTAHEVDLDVLKPAEDTSLSALRFAEMATAAGLPEGALNIVTGRSEGAGAALAAHPGIAFVSFTGSNVVGTLVQQAAAKIAVNCVLELGDTSPQIVFDDADGERAVPIIVRAIVQNAGQPRTAGSRLLGQASIYDRFVDSGSGQPVSARCSPRWPSRTRPTRPRWPAAPTTCCSPRCGPRTPAVCSAWPRQ